ncbi:hypothetical protein TNCV_3311411 [Trichonephila clavipes]|nr:hypothetical protein TNCV_3311411 [Trichonephila clavipes]
MVTNQFSECRRRTDAVSVPPMTTKGVRLSKEMAPQTKTPEFAPGWRAIGKAGSARCPGLLHTYIPYVSGHSWKRDSSLNTICPQSAWFQHDRTNHYFIMARQCAG